MHGPRASAELLVTSGLVKNNTHFWHSNPHYDRPGKCQAHSGAYSQSFWQRRMV